MKAMLEARIVAARIQRPWVLPQSEEDLPERMEAYVARLMGYR
jgi:hypothetical protein